MRKWKQREPIQPSSSLQVGLLCHSLGLVFDLPVSPLVFISLPSHRSLAICLCPFDPTSIEARPKNAPVLRNDALPGLPAPRTGHRVFAGERQCGSRIATSIGPRPPTLQTFGVPGAQAGSPAPCDGTRHELISRPIESVLRLGAVQPARDALAFASRISRLGWPCALVFLSRFLATVVCITAHHL